MTTRSCSTGCITCSANIRSSRCSSAALQARRRSPQPASVPTSWCSICSCPGWTGSSVARELHGTPDIPNIVLLTAQLHEDQLIEALHLGVRGFVLKEMATKLLVECLRRVHAGGQWLEKDSANRAMAKLVAAKRRGARSRPC